MSKKQQKASPKEIIHEATREVNNTVDLGKSYKKNDQSYLIIGLIIGLALAFALHKYWQIIENWQPLWVGSVVFAISIIAIFLTIYLLFRRPIFKMLFNIKLENYDAITTKLLSDIFPIVKTYLPESSKQQFEGISSTVENTIRQILAYQLYSRSRTTALGWLIGLVAGLSGYLGTTLLMKQNKLMQEQNTFLQRQIVLQQEQILTENKNKYLDIIYGDFSPSRIASALESYIQIERLSNRKAQIENLTFDSLSISNTKLDSSNFIRLTFKNCRFDNVDFSKSRFEKVSFIKCGFSDCKFDSCRMNVKFVASAQMSNSYKNSYMANSSFTDGSDVIMARFDGAFLSGCRFENCRLVGGNYEGAIIDKSGLYAINLNNDQDVQMINNPNAYEKKPYDYNRFVDEWGDMSTNGLFKLRRNSEAENLLEKNIPYYKLKNKQMK